MESPYYEMTHDLEEEKYIAERNFQSGYLKGYHDAVMKYTEIIRCRDCKHGYQLCDDYISCEISEENESGCHLSHKPDWFCADGERR